MTQPPIRDLEAFCLTCPPSIEVACALERLGFRLTLQMEAIVPPKSSAVPALPPQYHYSDQYGTEVIYLAGRDTPEDGERYPAHESRFWLWPGSQTEAYQRAASALAHKWYLTWLATEPAATTRRKQSA
jgi:hypothetical protein